MSNFSTYACAIVKNDKRIKKIMKWLERNSALMPKEVSVVK